MDLIQVIVGVARVLNIGSSSLAETGGK